MYLIYCHTNKINGKSYIGWTNKTMIRRWEIHCKAAMKNIKTLFCQALRKYGISDDVWNHETIECQIISLEIAKEAERFWIADRKTNHFRDGHYGYNMTDGGDGFRGCFKPRTEEHCKAISEGQIKRYKNNEARETTSFAVKKAKATPVGYANHCKAQQIRYSDPVNRQKMHDTNTQKRRVIQLSLDDKFIAEFSSISVAIRETGVLNIKLCCRGKRNHAGGFHWRYAEEVLSVKA